MGNKEYMSAYRRACTLSDLSVELFMLNVQFSIRCHYTMKLFEH
jgi:hypothetical protein